MEETRERVRVNAKQTSKGEWYFEATFEDEATSVDIDRASSRLLEAVKAVEEKFRADGKVLAAAS